MAYLYDGMNIIQESSGGSPVANLLNGSLDEVLTRTDAAGTMNFLMHRRPRGIRPLPGWETNHGSRSSPATIVGAASEISGIHFRWVLDIGTVTGAREKYVALYQRIWSRIEQNATSSRSRGRSTWFGLDIRSGRLKRSIFNPGTMGLK